jgi:hypothetical protein
MLIIKTCKMGEIYIFTIVTFVTRPILILRTVITYLPEDKDKILQIYQKRAFLRT